MAATLKLEIVTPAATVYSEDVHLVTLPAADGQIGIFPRHLPLLTRVVPGEIIVRKNGATEFLAIGEGLVEVMGDRVAIVTDMAGGGEGIQQAPGGGARHRAGARPRDTNSHEEMGARNPPRPPPPAPPRVQRKNTR